MRDIKTCALDKSANGSVEMTTATYCFPDGCQAVLPSLDTDFGCERMLDEEQLAASLECRSLFK